MLADVAPGNGLYRTEPRLLARQPGRRGKPRCDYSSKDLISCKTLPGLPMHHIPTPACRWHPGPSRHRFPHCAPWQSHDSAPPPTPLYLHTKPDHWYGAARLRTDGLAFRNNPRCRRFTDTGAAFLRNSVPGCHIEIHATDCILNTRIEHASAQLSAQSKQTPSS